VLKKGITRRRSHHREIIRKSQALRSSTRPWDSRVFSSNGIGTGQQWYGAAQPKEPGGQDRWPEVELSPEDIIDWKPIDASSFE
jgi:hypothetical protein